MTEEIKRLEGAIAQIERVKAGHLMMLPEMIDVVVLAAQAHLATLKKQAEAVSTNRPASTGCLLGGGE